MKRIAWLGAGALIALAAAIPVWLVLGDGDGSDGRRAAALQEQAIDCSAAEDQDLCAEGSRLVLALDGHLVVAEESLTAAQVELERWEEKLNSIGDDAQLANVDLQNILQKQQQTLQMLSNISKMLYDTAQSVIRKMGG
jgi:hypothetical protein